MSESPARRLLDVKLQAAAGTTLEQFVRDRRPPQKSWRELADELRELTGESTNRESLRQWFGELVP